MTLVESLLRSRGIKGATQDELQGVVAWARSIRAEGQSLTELSARPRRAKTQAPADRVARFEMNRALLDGVLGGTIALDVQDDGVLIFLHSEHLPFRLAYDASDLELLSDEDGDVSDDGF